MDNQNDNYKISLSPITVNSDNERAKALLESAKKQTGMIPNMYANMANFPAMLETYGTGYNLFRKEGGFTPAEQEIVFLTISRENGCEYCMAAHSVIADKMSKLPIVVTDAIRNDGEISDEKLKELSVFTGAMVSKRGRPSTKDAETFLKAGYSEQHILAIILAIAVKTLSNYSNHIFDTQVDAPFREREWQAPKTGSKPVNFS
ncbi:MAG TPA: carboxymuconolactone decarboxylase family protein [Puia sp.]